MRKALSVVVLLIITAAPAVAVWVGLPPVGGVMEEEVWHGGCCSGPRAHLRCDRRRRLSRVRI